MPHARCCVAVGLEYGCIQREDIGTPRLAILSEYALCLLQCKLSQHHAIGLQTDCMVVVPAPVVRLPDSYVYALWPKAMGCHPCNNNNMEGFGEIIKYF